MTDPESIQGVWKIITAERGGAALPADVLSGAQVEFAGEAMTTTVKGRATTYNFSLDSSRSPGAIDIDMGTAIGLGIYRIQGESLSLAHGEAGDPRPHDFSAAPGSRLMVMRLERRKA